MIEQELKETLISMQSAISAADAPTITTCLKRLDEALQEHRRELDPQLKHYLKRRSYEKALMFLDGQGDIPKGLCGGKG